MVLANTGNCVQFYTLCGQLYLWLKQAGPEYHTMYVTDVVCWSRHDTIRGPHGTALVENSMQNSMRCGVFRNVHNIQQQSVCSVFSVDDRAESMKQGIDGLASTAIGAEGSVVFIIVCAEMSEGNKC